MLNSDCHLERVNTRHPRPMCSRPALRLRHEERIIRRATRREIEQKYHIDDWNEASQEALRELEAFLCQRMNLAAGAVA